MIGLNRIGLYLCDLVEMSTVDASFHCLPVITVSVVIGGFMYGFALKLWWVLALRSPYRHNHPAGHDVVSHDMNIIRRLLSILPVVVHEGADTV